MVSEVFCYKVRTSGRSPVYDMYMIQFKYEKQLLRKKLIVGTSNRVLYAPTLIISRGQSKRHSSIS